MEKQSKKYLNILILKILESQTDENHPLTQNEILSNIPESIKCDRKTVCRNIKFLKEIHYPIVKTSKGFYLDKKKFSLDEISFITKAILNCQEKPIEERSEILDKLLLLLTKIYR